MKHVSAFLALAAFAMAPFAGQAQQLYDNGNLVNNNPVTPTAYLGPCDTLGTTFIGGNGQDGNIFSIRARKDIIIQSFEGNITDTGTMKIYYRMGSYNGFESTPGAWTFVDSALVMPDTVNEPTLIPIPMHIQVDSGQVISFYITGNGSGASVNYTNGTLQDTIYSSDAYMEIWEGIGMQYPFVYISSPRVFNGIVHYCPNIDYCDQLTTTYAGGNGNDGIAFEVVALQNTVIRSFEASLTDSGYVSIYYHLGPYVGTLTNPASWTLVDSAYVISNGYNMPTEIPINVNLFMQAGDLYSFIVTGNGIDQSVNYTNGVAIGAAFTNDNTLQVREGEGFAAPFGGGNGSPRVFNGTIRYCEAEVGETVLCQDIFVTDSMGNGNNGVMFDIDAKNDAVEIESFETYLDGPATQEVRIYYKMGTHVGFEESDSAWTLIDSMQVTTTQTVEKVTLPIPVNVQIPANGKYAFFIYTSYALEYSNGHGTTVPDTIFAQDNYVRVHEGSGKGSIFGPGFNNPRVFNGEINYCVLEDFIGIDEPEISADGLTLWPNPSNGIFTVAIPKGEETILKADILDMEGRVVYTSQQAANTFFNFDISGAPAGVYFVKVQTNKNIHTKKVILSGN